jgi:pSer/pThr/pTyr-binding forkhead associated (FHA) protein
MDGLVLKEINLNKDRVTIGRRPSNDIQIDNLAISGEHAAVVTILDDSFFEDLNSTNGTLVNGQPIKKHCLQNGDVVELGKYKLKYIVEPQSGGADYVSKQDAPPDRAVDAAPPHAEDVSASRIMATVVTPVVGPVALGCVQILNGAKIGRELELTKNLTSLGKPGQQVAVIARRPQGYFITHVEGMSFPTVNGQTLNAKAHPLKNHDVIEIAGIKMEFFMKGSALAAKD